MNLLLNLTDVSLDKIYFSDKKTNMIMDGFFTKLMFSNDYVTMHGLYIDMPIKNPMVNKIYSRNVLQLDIYNNKDIIQKFIDIEHQLLQYYSMFYQLSINESDTCMSIRDRKNKSKSFSYNLKSQLQNGSIKYYKDMNDSQSAKTSFFYIKISGIWENQDEIGITFKLLKI